MAGRRLLGHPGPEQLGEYRVVVEKHHKADKGKVVPAERGTVVRVIGMFTLEQAFTKRISETVRIQEEGLAWFQSAHIMTSNREVF